MVDTIAGMQIKESPYLGYPKLKLSDDVMVTDQFRQEMNTWLLMMFGRVDAIVMIDPITRQKVAVLSPQAYDKLHEAVERMQPPKEVKLPELAIKHPGVVFDIDLVKGEMTATATTSGATTLTAAMLKEQVTKFKDLVSPTGRSKDTLPQHQNFYHGTLDSLRNTVKTDKK